MIWTRPLGISLCLILMISQPLFARQAVAPTAQPSVLLQKALAGLSGNVSVSDVTLSGTARRIAGSDDETGTVTLEGMADGHSRMDLTFPSGPRSEVYSLADDGPVGSWSGSDGTAHSIALHDLWTNHSWFFPAFTLASFLNSQNSSIAYVGQETKNGQAVIHISASLVPPGTSAKSAKLMQHLSQTDIYLDPTSLLPVAITFNTHPDDNAALDIPVEIRFSDYQPEGGVQVPMHVQKFLNYSLVLDLQFQSATFNSGLAATDFPVQ
jgi:hypothetical protein